jgi:hypothetical protein
MSSQLYFVDNLTAGRIHFKQDPALVRSAEIARRLERRPLRLFGRGVLAR